MSAVPFVRRQIAHIRQGGRPELIRKIKIALKLRMPHWAHLFVLAFPLVVVIRLINPWLLVRWRKLESIHLHNFASDPELYFCERDAGINKPARRHIDLFYMDREICNQQLEKMLRRVLRVWPAWLLSPIDFANWLIPGGADHEVGSNTTNDRDVHNLMDRFPAHLQFSPEEEAFGEARLRTMGIPSRNSPFVCLNVRDSAYLKGYMRGIAPPGDSYRNSDVQNFVLAAEELADRGYFVFRMGKKVHAPIRTSHARIIDYATNGMRSDFMDMYLGAKCTFCISTGSGFEGIPYIFRRPIVFANFVPLGNFPTFSARFLGITKHHYWKREDRDLTLREIFALDVGYRMETHYYESKGVQLIENTPEEIRDVVVEMVERLNGTWRPQKDDESLQRRFWNIFPADAEGAVRGRPYHGEIRARIGAVYLRQNRRWLE